MSTKKNTVAKRAISPKKSTVVKAKTAPKAKKAIASKMAAVKPNTTKSNTAKATSHKVVRPEVLKRVDGLKNASDTNNGRKIVGSGLKPTVSTINSSAISSSTVKTNGKSGLANGGLASAVVVTKAEVFHSGDKVVYPAHGVGAVDSIQSRTIGGSEAKFYMITISETGMKVMVPVSQAATVGLRKIVDSKTVEKVYDILRDKDVTVQQQTWNRRFREYTQKLKTGSVFEIAKVIRDLSVLKSDKELSFGERKMLDTAQGLLIKELSIAKARSEELIREELQTICDA